MLYPTAGWEEWQHLVTSISELCRPARVIRHNVQLAASDPVKPSSSDLPERFDAFNQLLLQRGHGCSHVSVLRVGDQPRSASRLVLVLIDHTVASVLGSPKVQLEIDVTNRTRVDLYPSGDIDGDRTVFPTTPPTNSQSE